MARLIRVIVFRVGKPPSVERIVAGLNSLQKIVGGLIERVPPALWDSAPGLDLFCNEEGHLLGLPYQWRADAPWIPRLRGDLFIARVDAKGNTISVTDADVTRYASGEG